MFHTQPKISVLLVGLLQIIMFLWNIFLTLLLSRIWLRGGFCSKDPVRVVSIRSPAALPLDRLYLPLGLVENGGIAGSVIPRLLSSIKWSPSQVFGVIANPIKLVCVMRVIRVKAISFPILGLIVCLQLL